MKTTKRTCGLPLICLVCGDAARGINFNLMTCMSCKTFFRRHATKQNSHLKCLQRNNCEINRQTRGDCSSCRLEKCLTLGMSPEAIGKRSERQNEHHQRKCSKINQEKKEMQLIQPSTLSLLEHDRSILTKDDWNLLSNMVHAYDATNIISDTKYRLAQQASLPLKLRSKLAIVLDVIKPCYTTFRLLLDRTPYYHILPISARQILVKHNCELFSYLSSLLVYREANIFDYSHIRTGCDLIYSHDENENFYKCMSQLEPNSVFVRISLFLCAFSPSCGVLKFNSSAICSSKSESISILKIQNIFVTMFWKYLLYQFGFTDAVRWFNSYVKSIVNMIQNLSETRSSQHDTIINAVTGDTTPLFTMENLAWLPTTNKTLLN